MAPAPYPCSGVERCPPGAVEGRVVAMRGGWGRYRYIPSMMSIRSRAMKGTLWRAWFRLLAQSNENITLGGVCLKEGDADRTPRGQMRPIFRL